MELQSSHIIYDGLTHNTDCLSVCQYNTDLNTVLEDILNYVDTCSLTIPTCYDLADNKLLTILQAVLDQSCECTVKVSEGDLCCGYLQDKLISSDGSVIFEYTKTSCQQIDLSVNTDNIYNSIVEVSDLNSSTLSINGNIYNLSLPIGVLPTDGSALNINFVLEKDADTTTPTTNINIGANPISLITGLSGAGTINIYSFRVVRTSNITVVLIGNVSYNQILNPFLGSYVELGRNFYSTASLTVSNLDLNALPITISTVISSGSITGNSLFIDKYNK